MIAKAAAGESAAMSPAATAGPPEMLGRVSSLDFFVSLALLPVSTAIAGPLGEAVGYAPVFLVAGLAPAVLAVVAIAVARMPRDELAHPLDADPHN